MSASPCDGRSGQAGEFVQSTLDRLSMSTLKRVTQLFKTSLRQRPCVNFKV